MRNAKYCVFWPSIRENHNIFRYQQVRIRFNLLVRVSDSPDRNVSFLTAPNTIGDEMTLKEIRNYLSSIRLINDGRGNRIWQEVTVRQHNIARRLGSRLEAGNVGQL